MLYRQAARVMRAVAVLIDASDEAEIACPPYAITLLVNYLLAKYPRYIKSLMFPPFCILAECRDTHPHPYGFTMRILPARTSSPCVKIAI
ncbi:Uncharacterised protein [Serratia rubidaea]|uniref:Uncharacterized protein n=1 Tax=Serratia rubidaea TaxID=61652 RepID=A0A4V6JII8_SERRU|nr:hypothetical protein [Serratia rubidaea]QPR64780.1 hypothetical protein I6G83_05860 [Serratia rubidaea]CAI1115041.1 Uncharacterised protein [Serratia rubidaea]CAI1903459.1 Uncharacterised protein [Serratia rubidaea]VTP68373.1 Uncharacterised protein [Serratia rubidaea]HAY0639024.1 hypothetical protein [Serratia rubidaea]